MYYVGRVETQALPPQANLVELGATISILNRHFFLYRSNATSIIYMH